VLVNDRNVLLALGLGFVVSIAIVWAILLVARSIESSAATSRPVPSVVGAWFVSAPDAPFPRHVFVFHADGTMEQSNPDAGDVATSDSAGFGQWSSPRSGEVTGRFGEVKATRDSGAYVGSGVVSFTLTVRGDRFTGSASAEFFDAAGRHVAGPLVTSLSGERVAGDGPR
jgi:hypothetical protein